MSEIWSFFRLLMILGSILTGMVLILFSLPQSKLRDALMPIANIGVALLCCLYVVSPIDFLPEIALGPIGCIDDIGAIVAAFASVRKALSKPTN